MYGITEGFSPILCCRPDVITLGNPFDTRVPDYSSSSFLFCFQKMKRKLSPRREKIFRDNKSKYYIILVHVQKMYKTLM